MQGMIKVRPEAVLNARRPRVVCFTQGPDLLSPSISSRSARVEGEVGQTRSRLGRRVKLCVAVMLPRKIGGEDQDLVGCLMTKPVSTIIKKEKEDNK